ncbi:hypothetical protein [Pontixanthobacter aquaemixtae]|uniref:Uncharacterized protein n=1 Tax=Pontixanthobacter aquaemixtae TaxID=1958940 RepID=A0A844ZU45_9SPHN|nr:hypothetical protein [Pontixanthobacter aquaemixtae]MXO91831.1 hypothetical protein [Pontixanthobacter aquaemixtae]
MMIVVDRAYHWIIDAGGLIDQTDPVHFAIDIFALFSLGIIALRANRNYPLWLTGFQIVATVAHLAKALMQQISPTAYAVMYIAPSYFLIIILGLGIWFHHRRVKRFGMYRSWRDRPLTAAQRRSPS